MNILHIEKQIATNRSSNCISSEMKVIQLTYENYVQKLKKKKKNKEQAKKGYLTLVGLRLS